MPKCKKCDERFPCKIKVDGKVKSLQNRKYCLTCSPYKQHNTKKLEVSSTIRKETTCKICGRVYIYDKDKGHGKTKCNSCTTNGRRREIKQKCIDYKGGKCAVCGYNKCNGAMVFHHINKEQKDFAINYAMSLSWGKIKIELDKCILLCNRCHVEIHNGIIDTPVAQR